MNRRTLSESELGDRSTGFRTEVQMIGTVSITDQEWYEFLRQEPDLAEVNFWKPSARRAVRAPELSPFLFKLKSPYNSIGGFASYARFSRLPPWLAWDVYGRANGSPDFATMQERITRIRHRIRYQPGPDGDLIGCVLLVSPVFFPPEAWIPQPADWPVRTQTDKKYELSSGMGLELWDRCLATARALDLIPGERRALRVAEGQARYGRPTLITPRLGQRTFRIGVMDAYGRACAMTQEHSLPALDAAHIQPFEHGGPHVTSNGVLLRADLHRLFDKGYLTITPDLRLEVSNRLRAEYHNGRTYYPLHGQRLRKPSRRMDRPDPDFLRYHNEHVFAA